MIVYWDASALAKLFLDEHGSSAMRELWSSEVPASTSEISVAELACALAAAIRGRRCAPDRLTRSVLDGTFLTDRAELVRASVIVRSASELGARNGLRALDAIHVASALFLREANPTLVSWDRDQRRAAVAEGIPVYP